MEFRETIHFSKNGYRCRYNISSPDLPKWYNLYITVSSYFIRLLTFTILTVTSSLFLVAAKKAGNRAGNALRWEGVVTVLSTVIVLILSSLPLCVVASAWLSGVTYPGTAWRAAASLQYLNIVANFFIYSVSVQSFREFLKGRLLWVADFCALTKRSRLSTECSTPRQESRPCTRVKVGSMEAWKHGAWKHGSMEDGAVSTSLEVKIQDVLPKFAETVLCRDSTLNRHL